MRSPGRWLVLLDLLEAREALTVTTGDLVRGEGASAPRCLKCGYLLIGLRSTRCPECGDEPTLDELWRGVDAGM